ncbi:HEAT repeat domain-containing protein [Actinomadura sp. 9N215]|uniref:HEAT repeat domain-containing protein n=1 Tax=Actinomadura sp. 9N215 TaxID=3375150 RepID=UPI00379572D5
MSGWIHLLCREALGGVTAARLRDGITGGDPWALAGVDYLTLAEDYPVGDAPQLTDVVADALGRLTVEEVDGADDGLAFLVGYGAWPVRPLAIHRWDLRQAPDVLGSVFGGGLADGAAEFAELVGIRLWRHQLSDMGLVLGYEVARYLGQLGRAVVVPEAGKPFEVEDGGWRPSAFAFPNRAPSIGSSLADLRVESGRGGVLIERARALSLRTGGTSTEKATTLAAIQKTGPHVGGAPLFLDRLADEAMDDGGVNAFFMSSDVLALVHQYLICLPDRRAEALIAPPGGVRWRFLLDRPTPYVVGRAIQEVADWPRVANIYVRDQAIHALLRLDASAVPELVEALESRRPQRLVLLAALAAIASPDGLETLVAHLADPLDRVRAVAQWGVRRLGSDIARPRMVLESRWCPGCGLLFGDHSYPCSWCGKELQTPPALPWRALAAPECPVSLSQK